MLEAHLGELLKVDLGRGEEAYRLAVTAQLLVQHFPGSIEPDCRRELAVAFCEIIDKLNQRRHARGRLATIDVVLIMHALIGLGHMPFQSALLEAVFIAA